MKKFIIGFSVVVTISLISYFLFFSVRYTMYEKVNLEDYMEDYNISEIYDMQSFYMEDVVTDLAFRGEEYRPWNYLLIHAAFTKYAEGSLALSNDGKLSLFIVPRTKRFDILYLDEYVFPSQEVVLAELDKLQEMTAYDITYITEPKNSFIIDPRIKVFDIQDKLGDEFEMATLYALSVADINENGTEVFLIIGEDNTYAFIEYDVYENEVSLYHIFE
ncbi:MAG: hypothetical protein KQ78_00825 [Candidatus Izimaplasma bacterium HR2]|nr:MAG: hypothetical protein KQ78_00825 [Candidatus Izimaplasma bacterium HR2]